MSVGSIEIKDWRSEWLWWFKESGLFSQWQTLNLNIDQWEYWIRWILVDRVKFYQRSQYKYYYGSDYKVRHKMCKPISRHHLHPSRLHPRNFVDLWEQTQAISRHLPVSFLCVIFWVLLVISRGQEPWNVFEIMQYINKKKATYMADWLRLGKKDKRELMQTFTYKHSFFSVRYPIFSLFITFITRYVPGTALWGEHRRMKL